MPEEPPKVKPRLNPDTTAGGKAKPNPAPASIRPSAATVAVRPTSSTEEPFLFPDTGRSKWPVDEPQAKLRVWKKRDGFLAAFLDRKVVIAHCPTGSGKSTILPALAAMHLHPNAGRVCCTQIRRVTTQSVCRNTKDIWDIPRESLIIGYTHGTEKLEHWNRQQTKVLFLTERIIMRQVMSHDEHKHPETILPGCKVLMLDEAHSGSTDIELILARILPRISQVKNFRLVLMSATLNVETFLKRVTDAGVPRSDVGIFHMDERTNPLALYCVPTDLFKERDNMELALRMIIKIHHEYRDGYERSRGSINGPILVFVPGKAEIRLLIELIKNAVKRGYTSGLYPYGFHADTPDRDRTFLTNGGDDPDPSRYGELHNYNKGKKVDEKHPCHASAAARPKNPENLPSRRVIISTNAAETAVTFKNCWAVIDTCLVNQMVYDPVAKTQIHATVPCPKTASKQRAGRTGRTIPGINIKLITQQEWDNLPDTEPPQPQLEDPVPIFLRLMRHSTVEVRNRVLDQLGIDQSLRASLRRASEHQPSRHHAGAAQADQPGGPCRRTIQADQADQPGGPSRRTIQADQADQGGPSRRTSHADRVDQGGPSRRTIQADRRTIQADQADQGGPSRRTIQADQADQHRVVQTDRTARRTTRQTTTKRTIHAEQAEQPVGHYPGRTTIHWGIDQADHPDGPGRTGGGRRELPLFPSPFPFSLSPCPFPLSPCPFPLFPGPFPLFPFPCPLSQVSAKSVPLKA